MAEGKYKPCSFYVPERDTELMRFMASQSNMSLSMRLLMKAFLASNRHATDIDVSLMDLADLIRSMRVDPDLFEDVPRRVRPIRSISAVEAEEARAAAREEFLAEQQALQAQPRAADRSEPGFGQRSRIPQPAAGYADPPAANPPQPAPEPVRRADEPPAGAWPPEPPVQPGAAAKPAPQAQPPAQEIDDMDPASMMGEGF